MRRLLIIYLAVSISVVMPLSPLTIYAQNAPAPSTDTEEPEGELENLTYDALRAKELAAATAAGISTEPSGEAEEPEALTHTFYSGAYINDSDNPLSITFTGGDAAIDGGIYYVPNDFNAAETTTASSTNTRSFAAIGDDTNPDANTAITIADRKAYESSFSRAADNMRTKLSSAETYGNRLAINADDLVALTGENGGDCATWNEAEDDYFINGFCDPPRADRRIILALDYLLRPRTEGGGGREYIKVNKIVQYPESGFTELNESDTSETEGNGEPVLNDANRNGLYDKPTDSTPAEQRESFFDLNGNGQYDASLSRVAVKGSIPGGGLISPHYIDLDPRSKPERDKNGVATSFSSGDHTLSQAMDISEIDRIRVTTRINRKGLFGQSNKYNYQRPVNIKVAWQSDSGIAAHPLPELSVHELIKGLGVNSILELLDADGALGDFDFQGRSIDTLSLEDIAKFVGGRLLSTLLDGADISNFNFDDTLRDFGAIVLAGSFNVDVNAVRNAKSIGDIEEYTGRTDVAKTVGVEGVITGDSKIEIYQSIGRQRFADLMGIKAYALTKYHNVDEFKLALGWGRIEQLLPVPEQSFASNNRDEVRAAIKDARFKLIFTTENAAIIAERLQIPTDKAQAFIDGGSVADFKKVVGEVVWKNNIDRYKVNNYIPRHPACVALSVAGESNDVSDTAQGSLKTAIDSLTKPAGVTDNGSLEINIPELEQIRRSIRDAATLSNQHLRDVGITEPLKTQCGYTDANLNQNARRQFVSRYNQPGDGIRDQLDGFIDLLEAQKPVVVNNNIQLNLPTWASRLYAAIEELYIARDALTQYVSYDQNPDGTGQQRDLAFGMPAGVTYDIIGGEKAPTAFKTAGIWYLSQRLPTNQRKSFIYAANSNDKDGKRQFKPANTTQEVYRDVFLSERPAHEFRRIGRRLLLVRVQNSANAKALKQTDLANDALFYFNRYQTIQTSLKVIKDNLGSLPSDVQRDLNQKIDNIDHIIGGAREAFDDRESVADSLNARGLAREYRDDIYELIDTVEKTKTLSDINDVLGAARDLERAMMEILEGQNVAYNQDMPGDISVPDINTPKVSGNSALTEIIGGDDLFVRAGFQAIGGKIPMTEILTQLGIGKLSRLLELPTDALLIYKDSDPKDKDAFFAAVGAGRRRQQNQRAAETREIEIREGKDYIIRYTIPGLARKLNINFPDYIGADDIAEFVIGNTTKALVGIGGTQLERILDLPKNFVTDVVYPVGNTDAARNESRQHTIINTVLKRLGLDLDLPAGFVLDQNPVVSMGAARIEGALNLERGDFQGTREDILKKIGDERFMAVFGIRLPAAAVAEKREADRLKPTIIKQYTDPNVNWCDPFLPEYPTYAPEIRDCLSDRVTTLEAVSARQHLEEYHKILKKELENVFAGTTLSGFDSADPKEKDDANRRADLLTLKLQSIDNQLHLDNAEVTKTIGTTQKWLEGAIDTNRYATMAGESGAALFGSDIFAAALTRLGIDGEIYDNLIKNDTNRHFLVTFFQKGSYTKPEFAQLYTILSQAFGVDIDKKIGFRAGTMARLITEKDTDDILFDQGVRLLANKYLHINLNDDTRRYDRTLNVKRIMQRAIFGAAYNEDTRQFEYDTANPYTGMIDAVRELNDMALQFLREQIIGVDLFRYIKAPLNALFAIGDMNLQALEEGNQYLSIYQAMHNAVQEADRPTDEVLGRVAQAAERLSSLQRGGGSSDITNAKIIEATKNGAVTNTSTGDPEEDDALDHFNQAQNDSHDPAYAETPPEPNNDVDLSNLGHLAKTPNLPKGATHKEDGARALRSAGEEELALQNIQLVNQAAWKSLQKEFAYALADFGLSKIIGSKIVAPGLTRDLLDGTASERTEAIAYVASQLLVKNFGPDLRDAGLGWLVEQDTIEDFIRFTQGHGQDFADELVNQGAARLGRLEDKLFKQKFFQYAGLKSGTLVGLFGYAIKGSTKQFELFGNNFKGLGQLYNTDWILGRVFFAAEKLTGVPAGKFAQIYFLGKSFYKAYVGWQAAKKTGDAAKIAKLKAQWVNAAIQLGVFVVDLAFGKDIAKFEARLGLPPGTITQAIGIILTALLIGTGPMFFVTLGIFLLVTVFGFGFTRIQTRATADGYFPYVGKKGLYSTPLDPQTGNVPYPQWPSADVLDNFARVTGAGTGEFDPTNESQKIIGFKEAARGKVIGLINDLFEASGRPGNTASNQYGSDPKGQYPVQVLIHLINEEPAPANLDQNFLGRKSNLYLKDKRYSTVIKRINNQYFPGACNGGQINTGNGTAQGLADPHNWGVCVETTGKALRDIVHIAF